MAQSKFTEETAGGFAELVRDGLSFADAARQLDISQKTARNWLSKGRSDPEGEYGEFARLVDEAKADAEAIELPVDPVELKILLSRAARKGAVAAMKHLDEIHVREAREKGGAEPADPFEELDGPIDLDAARKRRSAG